MKAYIESQERILLSNNCDAGWVRLKFEPGL